MGQSKASFRRLAGGTEFCQNDTVIPEAVIREAANKMPNARYYMRQSNHFELCSGEVFEKNIALQLAFLKRKSSRALGACGSLKK